MRFMLTGAALWHCWIIGYTIGSRLRKAKIETGIDLDKVRNRLFKKKLDRDNAVRSYTY